MINPLRCPIVLIVLLGVMVAYVHLSHRQRHRAQEMVASEDEPIKLRMSAPDDSDEVLRTRQPKTQASPGEASTTTPLPLPRVTSPAANPAGSRKDPLPRKDSLPQPVVADESEAASAQAPTPVATQRLRPIEPRSGAAIVRQPASVRSQSSLIRGRKTPPAYTRRFKPDDRPAQTAVVMHRIVDGDTLRDLAQKYLGDESRYLEIFHANRHLLVQPDLLPLGERLRIPD